jgi:hypothetical protein
MGDTDDIREWERKAIAALLGLLTAAFIVWAGVVWNGTDKVMVRMDTVAQEMSSDRIEQQQYRAILERRLTIQEQQLEIVKRRQDYVLDAIADGKAHNFPP